MAMMIEDASVVPVIGGTGNWSKIELVGVLLCNTDRQFDEWLWLRLFPGVGLSFMTVIVCLY